MKLARRVCARQLRRSTTALGRYWPLAVGCTLAGWCALATAQTFYKWTDDRGTVHFSDQAPMQATGVEERHLPVPAVSEPVQAAEERSPAGSETGEGSARKKAGTQSGEGPARVILVSRDAPRTGPSAMHIIGEVKNVGGADAQRVVVTISAVDSTQGTPCLQDEVPVSPSTLHPGETGNFDTDVDSPCLYGGIDVDIGPLWE